MLNAEGTSPGNTASRDSRIRPQSSSEKLVALAKAVVVSFAIATIGIFPWPILAHLNLNYWPKVPWSAVATLVYLALLWRYLSGAGWPAKTAAYRRTSLRAVPMNLSRRSQAVVVTAGGTVALVTLHLLCIKEGGIPLSALRPSFDPAELPMAAQVSAVVMTGLVAAVVEEAAYRGYLQSCLERLWGPRLAIVTIAAVFTLAHLPAAWSYPVVLISIFAAGILFGSVAAIFGSILPCVLLHAFVDWIVLPIEWGLIGRRWLAPLEMTGIDDYAMGLLVVAIVSGAVTVWTLAMVVHRTPQDS